MVVDQIVKYLRDNGHDTVTLSFSTGRDSSVCLHLLQQRGIRVIPFFFYIVPNMQFVNDTIRRQEDFYKVKIIQLPHPILYDFVRYQDLQTFSRADRFDQWYYGGKVHRMDFGDQRELYFKSINDRREYFNGVGLKQSDSLRRRLMIRKLSNGVDVARKLIYPASDFTKVTVREYCTKNRLYLSDDYKIFGRSFDMVKHDFVLGIKRFYPNDYRRLQQYFPLVEMEILRYEKYLRDTA